MIRVFNATGVSQALIREPWPGYRFRRSAIRTRLPRTVCRSGSGLSDRLADWAGIPEILSSAGDCYGWGRR